MQLLCDLITFVTVKAGYWMYIYSMYVSFTHFGNNLKHSLNGKIQLYHSLKSRKVKFWTTSIYSGHPERIWALIAIQNYEKILKIACPDKKEKLKFRTDSDTLHLAIHVHNIN